ncbi:hypothetical protein B0J12DRAFT_749156, partial [Macrophomina phaseolina]
MARPRFFQSRSSNLLRVYKLSLLACTAILITWFSWSCRDVYYFTHYDKSFPKKIWQILHYSLDEKPGFVDDYQAQWKSVNSRYEHECLTEGTEDSFVRDKFRYDSGIRQTYDLIKSDPILRADFLRYLILLAEGGVYTDVDTRPIRPVDDWIPSQYRNRTNVVLGIEIDKGQGPLWSGMPWSIQISQFTIMAKRNHPLIRRVVHDV